MAFVFASTFSIAISQILLGLSLALFLVTAYRSGSNPFSGPMKTFWIAVAVWIGWLLLTSALGKTPTRSLWLCREEWLFCIVPIAVYLFRFRQVRLWLIRALAAGVALLSVYCVVIYTTGWAGFSSYEPGPAPGFGWRVAGTFSHRMTFGNYYAVASTLLLAFGLGAWSQLSRFSRALIMTSALLGALATILTFGRGPIAVLCGSVIIALVLQGKRFRLPALSVVVAFVLMLVAIPGVFQRYSAELERDIGGAYEGGRMFIWENSVKVIADHPLLGTGQGNFKDAYVSHLREDIGVYRKLTHAHNDFLNVAAVSGIPGALFFMGMWAVVLRTLIKGWWRSRKDAGIESAFLSASLVGSICYLGVSLYEAAFVDEEVRQLLMFVWAVGLAVWYNKAAAGEKRITQTS
jgi:O-antigen ligase